MIKREVTGCDDWTLEPLKKARGIQFTVNEASAYVQAPEYAAFSKALTEVSSECFYHAGVKFLIQYSSKMNHADIGVFATESESLRATYEWSIIDERDGKNWDSNIQVCHREALINIYEALDGRLAAHARSGVSVRGRFRSKSGVKIKYSIEGTVKSGHPDTSSGNGAINREVSAQAIGNLPAALKPVEVRALVMGDDYIAWLYFDHPVNPLDLKAALNHEEAALGIHPERGLFYDIRNASFISLGFYLAHDSSVVALPKIGRLFSRLFWTVTDPCGRPAERLASGIAEAFYPLYCTFPLMRSFLKHHMMVPALGRGLNHYYCWDEIGLTRLPAPINWVDNHLVKYGVMAVAMPEEFAAEGFFGICDHPVISHCCAVDLADPAERIGHAA